MPRLVWRALGKSPFMICPPPVSLSVDFSKNTVYLYSIHNHQGANVGFEFRVLRRASVRYQPAWPLAVWLIHCAACATVSIAAHACSIWATA